MFLPKKLDLACVRFHEPHEKEFDDAARPPLRKFIADPIICLKKGSMSRFGFRITRPGEIVRTAAQ
jgi:hypothetical protein